MLEKYISEIFATSSNEDAREESFYHALKNLLEEYAAGINKKNVQVTTLPKRTEAGNPDFRVWDGKQQIVGYIEAKFPETDLNRIEDSEQLRRYLETFPNLILTDFFEFRLYRNGQLIDKVRIGRPYTLSKLKAAPPLENEAGFYSLLEKFFSFSLPKILSAKSLAIELAKRTRFLKDEVITQELKEEEDGQGKKFITGFYEAFRKYLIAGLTKEDFADLYSQTITYGLFAARTRSENGFNRKLAYNNIPHTIGILREVFSFISLGEVPQQMEWIIDDISEVLAETNVKKILHDYFREGRGKDPIIHFYETFLSEYDPATRERRGVYYTPEPVVSYIVRSLDIILKEKFGEPDGFAGSSVTVLDPAAGTLTFPAEAAKLAVGEFVSKYGEGGKENFIREYILRNFFAFELMMAPYAIGHLKISFLLEELGYKLKEDDRFKLYLTNTLEMEDLEQTDLPGMASLSEESHLAGKVKKEQPILVIMGNPPYYGHSYNASDKYITLTSKNGKERRKKVKTWIGELIEDYKVIDGKPLGEKNPKWLQDDYVKFIRFAQWKIDLEGEGVLGFITNHGYLDNPTFRGMRQSLMKSFDEIYILDLHGNIKKKEKSPDGSKDENVFEIMQGVSIGIFIKNKRACEKKFFYAEIWGAQKAKHDWLRDNNLTTTRWKELHPKPEPYLFVPRNEELLGSYEKWRKITEIFPVNSVGIVTARDSLTIKWSHEEVWQTVLNFSKLDSEIARQAYYLGKDTRDWKVELAQKDLLKSGLNKELIVPILYRPFDIRYTYYTGNSRGFHCMPRAEVMRHMIKKNVALITARSNKSNILNHFICGNTISEAKSGESTIQSYLFPLYLYPDTEKRDLFSQKGGERKPNIDPDFYKTLNEAYGKELTPEEIFYYIYAVLYSNTYRTRYAEFLKIDFPRVPFTKDHALFGKLAGLGEELVNLHLLKSPGLDSPIARFPIAGDNKVDKPSHNDGRVYINKTQYFDGVEKDVWQYQVGGYQVCSKWLKDRKGRTLTLDDIKHYCKVVTALSKTIEIQTEIDRLYDGVEKSLIELG
ncbi:MAG TPA: N-6 DNA methylase [Thermodesulfobacteriota bacterium]|nr:N-6 DNA methylase [Thermodesulfobacteriota bacterium]